MHLVDVIYIQIAGVAVVVLGLVYGIVGAQEAKNFRRRRLARRPSLAFSSIYHEYFQSLGYSRDMVEAMWNEAARELEIAPDRLRPTDRFDHELSSGIFICPDFDIALEARLEDRVHDAEEAGLVDRKLNASFDTIGQYIELSCFLESLLRQASNTEDRRATGRQSGP